MRARSLILFILLAMTATSPARAAVWHNQSSDMFYDQNWIYDRPSVPSDRGRSADFFPPIPPMFNSDADLYDHFQPKETYGREDMFTTHGLGLTRPYTNLTIDPPQGPYNAR